MSKGPTTWEAIKEFPSESALMFGSILALFILGLFNPWVVLGGFFGLVLGASMGRVFIKAIKAKAYDREEADGGE